MADERDNKGRFTKGNKEATVNKGKTKSVPEEIKRQLSRALPQAVDLLLEIMADPQHTASDRIKCAEIIINKNISRKYTVYAEQNEEADTAPVEVKISYV